MHWSSRAFHATIALAGLAMCFMLAACASAAPISGEFLTIREPNNEVVILKVWGDEFHAVGETADGFTVIRDAENGLLCYAALSEDGRRYVSTGMAVSETDPPEGLERHLRVSADAAREEALAARAEFERRTSSGPHAPTRPLNWRPAAAIAVGVTLIVDFSDDPGTISPASVDDYCNLPGYTGFGNNGSIRDYFFDVSDDQLEFTNYVPTAYYRAAHPKSYYVDPGIPYTVRASELVVEALTALDDGGFDFTQCDGNGDGVIDAVSCFYAGGLWNSWAEGLWPHAAPVSFCADGVCTNWYQITNMNVQLYLATFCHEIGHALMGWPDLYDYGADSAGLGTYCLMAHLSSATNPAEPCAYLKLEAGWADVTAPTGPATGLSVPSGENAIFRFDHPSQSNEYYLVENRQRVDRDSGLYDDGLAIYHVDENGNNSNQEQTEELHYEVTLVQADGMWDLESNVNHGDNTDLYAAPGYTECGQETHPGTDWWDGSPSGLVFSGIGSSGPVMSFDYSQATPPSPEGLAVHPEELSLRLEWDSLAIAHLDHYRVERDTTASFGAGTVSWTTTDTVVVEGPLEESTEYFHRVFAVDVHENESAPSDVVSGVALPDVPPAAPGDPLALSGGGAVVLVWPPNVEIDVIGYAVERDSLLAFAAAETLAVASGPPYADTTGSMGRGYWYRVAAMDATGHVSDWSAPAGGVVVTGQAVYVNAANPSAQNGSIEYPYRAIQAGIDDADPGDVVVVFAEDYDGPVQLKDGVAVIGMQGPSGTVVTTGVGALGLGPDTVLKGIRFDGLGVLDVALDCRTCRLSVEDCEFANTTSSAVKCHTGGAVVLRHCSFEDNQTAVSCSDSTAPIVESSSFAGSSFAHVLSWGDPGPVIGGSLAEANDFLDFGQFAIMTTGTSPLVAEYNYWGADCVESSWFSGLVDYEPWTDATHTEVVTECNGSDADSLPLAFALSQGFPNPFTSQARFLYDVPAPGASVSLHIYNQSGRHVRTIVDVSAAPGRHLAEWDGRDESGKPVASGVYFCRYEASGHSEDRKIVLLK